MLAHIFGLQFLHDNFLQLPLVVELSLLPKNNEQILIVVYRIFANRAQQGLKQSRGIPGNFPLIFLKVPRPVLQKAWVTEEMTFLLFTGAPLSLRGQIIL